MHTDVRFKVNPKSGDQIDTMLLQNISNIITEKGC